MYPPTPPPHPSPSPHKHQFAYGRDVRANFLPGALYYESLSFTQTKLKWKRMSYPPGINFKDLYKTQCLRHSRKEHTRKQLLGKPLEQSVIATSDYTGKVQSSFN